jgi:hypothetical protein
LEDPWVKGTHKNGQTKMKPPVKSLLLFISRSQAPGWITFGAEYIKAKTQTEAFCMVAKISELNIYKLFSILYVFQR